MLVKKFEARSMKEALEMVKTELGPNAIILSAKDNNKRFGLIGDGSVEITAAISEQTLQMKQFVENRMRENDRAKFAKTSARNQRTTIEKAISQRVEAATPKVMTRQRYIDIDNSGDLEMISETQALPPAISRTLGKGLGMKSAAPVVKPQSVKNENDQEINALKSEIENLRKVIDGFKQIPQGFTGGYPGADFGLPFDLSFMFEKLTQAGISPEIVGELLIHTHKTLPALHLKKRASIEAFVANQILSRTRTSEMTVNGPKMHLFVGAGGHGKTSTLVKLASHMTISEKKRIIIVSTDSLKVGASDQLRIYAQILNVPFTIVRGRTDWIRLEGQLKNADAVLVDFPGLSLRNSDELNLMKELMPQTVVQTHLVMSSTAKDVDAFELGRRYSALNFTDVIFTALDESNQHGVIFNFQDKFNAPLFAFGTGPKVPEDYEVATRERVLDLIFKISNSN